MLSRISQHRELAFHHKATPFNSKMKALEENYKLHSGGDVFQDYFDDVKESRVKQVSKNQESKSFKNQVSKNQDSRTIKFQESRFKNNQDQDSRIKRRLNQDKY